MKNFRDLRVRQVAHELTLSVYKITAPFPRQEMFGLDLAAQTLVRLCCRQPR
jgi:hypothetical protein